MPGTHDRGTVPAHEVGLQSSTVSYVFGDEIDAIVGQIAPGGDGGGADVGDDTRDNGGTQITNPESGQNSIDKRDYGHAGELRRAFAGRFRWVPERRGWARWTGHQWKAVPDERVFLVASRTLQKTYREYVAAASDKKEERRFNRKIKEACMASHITGGLKFLAGFKDILTPLARFDRKKWLLNLQ
ncbi:MAG TPA: hypothetical protein VFL31_07515, partial [Nitrospiraceae bacterium]|nr:hypothetical protein [Nitrospiraceae bacterium]